MMIGSRDLLNKYGGSALAVAEALLRNELDSSEMDFVGDVVSKTILEAAKARIENAGRATTGIKARVCVVLRDRSDQSKKYIAEKDVIFPMDPTRLGRVCLKVGKKDFSFSVDSSLSYWKEENGILTISPHHNFRPYADEEWLAKGSGWKVTPQK